MPQIHPPVSASPSTAPTTNRHRERRTMLSGCLHFMKQSTAAAGPAINVNGQRISETSGVINVMESYSVLPVSMLAALALPAPAATHDGHHTPAPNWTAHNSHTKRPHCRQAPTACLPG